MPSRQQRDPPGPVQGEAAESSGNGERAIVPAGLHLVATPIGNARDITLRALDILAGADVLAAEDTRSLRKLMEIHGIARAGRPLLAYHDHNGPRMRPHIMEQLAQGKSVAYASEAGTPLVADPGYQLASAAIDAGFPVLAAPGASAVLAALTVSGLPTDRFCFLGFPPTTRDMRRRFLTEAARIPATLILYESPRRVRETLGDLCDTMGSARKAVAARELTKRFESVARGTLGELVDVFAQTPPRGEFVILIERPAPVRASRQELEEALEMALQESSLSAAVAQVSADLGLPRREVYQAALTVRDAR